MLVEMKDKTCELSQWFKARTKLDEGYPYSIFIHSPCLVCQPRIAESLTKYLNEFDDLSDGSTWLFLDDDRREEIRLNSYINPHHPIDAEELDKFLFSYGNIVFESSRTIDSIPDSEHIFKVHLSCKEPGSAHHDMWLNAKKIDPETLRLMIASSFMEWARRNPNWKSTHPAD